MVIALEGRLRKCKNVTTLGVKTNFGDYSPEDAGLMSERIESIYRDGHLTFETALIRSDGDAIPVEINTRCSVV